MKHNGNLLAATALALSLTLGSVAFAGQGPGDGYGPHGGEHGGMMGGKHDMGKWQGHLAQKLNLTDEQKAQVEAIREASKDESKALRDAMRAAAQAERAAVDAGASEAELRDLARTTADKRVDMMLFGMKKDKEFRALLTPEQITQLDQLKAERKARWTEHQQQREQKMEGNQ